MTQQQELTPHDELVIVAATLIEAAQGAMDDSIKEAVDDDVTLDLEDDNVFGDVSEDALLLYAKMKPKARKAVFTEAVAYIADQYKVKLPHKIQ